MTTINAGNITKGSYILFKGAPVGVTKTEFMSPGKGSPVMRIKFKNIQTGSAGEFTYKTSEQVEVAEVEKKEMQFLYREGKEVIFIDPKTYEQASVPVVLLEGQVGYLTPNLKCWVLWYRGEAIGVALPSHVTLKVVESPDEVAGNRINAPKKLVKTETGIAVAAPLFIKVGEKIMIDTSTGEYLSRVK
ncbi:elongation factor P [Candidatus Shapirobacteria bacterium CG03_land_8_20_14_0_80_39_12]|uniref:Elongation factor P n=1 Tax=Candidatus Shapirobacteria bacterium CG03_land_8_20_14_0_80_39_12 TaxID=1974879 RepID=A0A2M7BFG7_9BACT|nr:MAG: elongation factor P [Candidatus Shapirobacteria bacterium CG03_land_8_20_14_0_80_39_12]